MYPLVYKYLMNHHHVGIPGVGNFIMERTAARFDFINKCFHPPLHKICFCADGTSADKKFYRFLANEKNVDDVQAVQLFNDFAFTLKNNINNEASVELPGIGTLQKSEDNSIVFVPIPLTNKYLPDILAHPVVRKDGQEHYIIVGDEQRTKSQQLQELQEADDVMKPKDYWWIFAIILALSAVGAIIYYYYVHGTLR